MNIFINKSSNYLLKIIESYNSFFLQYSYKTFIIILLLLAANLSEIVGLTALLIFSINIFSIDHDKSNKITEVYDTVTSSLNLEPNLASILIFFTICIFGRALISFIAFYYSSAQAVEITYQMRKKLLNLYLNSTFGFLLKNPIGSMTYAMDFESERTGIVYEKICRLTNLLIQAILYSFLSLLASWKLTLFIILFAATSYYLINKFNNLIFKLGSITNETRKSFIKNMNNYFGSIKVFKSSGNENIIFTNLHQLMLVLLKSVKKYWLAESFLTSIQEPLLFIFLIFSVFFGIFILNEPVTSLIFIALAFFRISTRLFGFYSSTRSIVSFLPALNSLSKTLNLAKKEQEKGNEGLKSFNLNKNLIFKKINFKYKKNTIFKNASFTIFSNKINFIFGRSGIGKTTILDLLVGLQKVESGSIKIGNLDLNSINLNLYRRNIGYVTQDPLLFNDSILNNLTLSKQIDKNTIIKSLKISCCDSFVKNDNDLKKIVGTSGSKLSGGQRQKIAIARALIKSPKILILDEATSEINKEDENKIFKNLKKIGKKITFVVISHDHRLKKYADLCYKVSNQKVYKI